MAEAKKTPKTPKAPLSPKELEKELAAYKLSEGTLKDNVKKLEAEIVKLKEENKTLLETKNIALQKQAVLTEALETATNTLTGINSVVKLGSKGLNSLATYNERLPEIK